MIKKVILIYFLFILLSALDSNKLNKAIELYNSSKYEEAINILKELSKDNPEEAEIHLWLSKSYEAIFNIDEAIKENKIYQKLKYLNEKKKEEVKVEKKQEIKTEVKKKIFENLDIEFYPGEVFDYSKLILITPEFISDVILQRKQEELDKKPLNSELIIDLIMNKKDKSLFQTLEIKKHYLLTTHQEDIIYKNIETENILEEIKYLNSKFLDEKNQDKKNELNLTLKRLAISYNKKLNELITLINKPVYTNTDPLSFEHFLHLKIDKKIFIKTMLEKKESLQNNLNEIELNIKNYSKEFEINKNSNIENKLKNFILERDILKEAILKIENTISKVKSIS
jgi:hypothetical protein